ncbi:hypothetical protein VS883_28060, partial [Escherichia coli]
RLQFYRWPDKHGVSGITDLFFRPIKNAQSLLTGAAKIFSQIRLREVKGLKDYNSTVGLINMAYQALRIFSFAQ